MTLSVGRLLLVTSLIACTGDDPIVGPQTNVDGGGPSGPSASLVLKLPSSAMIQQGGPGVSLDVEVTRSAGFDEPLTLTLANAPTGVGVEPLAIPPGANAGKLALSARADAAQGSVKLDVVVSNSTGSVRSTGTIDVVVRGAPGAIDTTFGAGGTVTIDVGTSMGVTDGECASSVAELPDARLIVLASSYSGVCSLRRYSADGTLDTAFGNGGTLAFIPVPGAIAGDCRTVLVQDGKVIVGSYVFVPGGQQAIAVTRLELAGNRGADAGSFVEPTRSVTLGGLALDGDGVLAAGFSDADDVLAVLRLGAGGTADTAFGTAGFVTSEISDTFGKPSRVVWAKDAVVGVAGTGSVGTVVMKRTKTTTKTERRFLVPPKSDDVLGGFGVDREGRAYVAATVTPEGRPRQGVLLRFPAPKDLAANVVDPTFGAGGLTTLGDVPSLTDVGIAPDGTVLGIGRLGAEGLGAADAKVVLVRTGADGIRDEAFGLKTISAVPSSPVGSLMTRDGKLIVLGHGTVDKTVCFARRVWL